MTDWLVRSRAENRIWLRNERAQFSVRYSRARQRSEKRGQYIVTEKLAEGGHFVLCAARPKFHLAGEPDNVLELWGGANAVASSGGSDSVDSEVDRMAAAANSPTAAVAALAAAAAAVAKSNSSERKHLPTYTLEVIRKANLINKSRRNGVNYVSQLLEAKRLQLALRSPFLCRLIDSFKDHCNVYFVKPDCRAGTLRQHILMRANLMTLGVGGGGATGARMSMLAAPQLDDGAGASLGNCFSAQEIRFVAAQIVLALEYLENARIVHRDIRSENVQFDYRGYLYLTDFTCAKRLHNGRAYTLIGCPDVIAPEMLECLFRSSVTDFDGCDRLQPYSGYSTSVDCWALGLLMHEMVAGRPLFNVQRSLTGLTRYMLDLRDLAAKSGEDRLQHQLHHQHQHQQTQFRQGGDRCQQLMFDMIAALINVRPFQRLGCGRSGVRELRGHQFFCHSSAAVSPIDFFALQNKTARSEYQPNPEVSMYPETELNCADIGCDQFDQFSEEFDEF